MTTTAHPGTGGELAAVMLSIAQRLRGFPGCEIYLISQDSTDPDTVHVTEVWRDEASAQAALATPPPADGPTPAQVLALMAAPPQRTDSAYRSAPEQTAAGRPGRFGPGPDPAGRPGAR